MAHTLYASVTESLMYAMLFICPDICLTFWLISLLQRNPRHSLKSSQEDAPYLREMLNYMLYDQIGDKRLYGYTGADWSGD